MTVVWITGLPSSGKSTFARRLHERLATERRSAVVLDGDEIRDVLGMRGYEPSARDAFYRALAGLAAVISRQGPIAIVAATAPALGHRAYARELASRFVEVLVDTPPVECERRDSKGLYAAARRGDVSSLPGDGATYERPVEPDVIASGGDDEAAIAAITRRIDALRGSSGDS